MRDDGKGLSESDGAGQGLKNIRKRTESIDGGLTVTSKPGFGTALEVVLKGLTTRREPRGGSVTADDMITP